MQIVHDAAADEFNPVRREPAADSADQRERRIIVKFRADGGAERARVQAAGRLADEQVASLASRTGFTVTRTRTLAAELSIVEIAPDIPDTGELLTRIRADATVEYAEIDRRRHLHSPTLPNDPLYTGQWYLQNRDDAPSAVDAEGAWAVTTGSAGVVVAVIDSGILFDHPDMGYRVLPGYDFVSDPFLANDGDGWDADASDPGDWVTSAEATAAGCSPTDSSWHGTRVAGIIGAQANNATGIAGTTWESRILPVRAFGKCGSAFDSDILAAMLWATGFPVEGVPDNPHPARVLNLSFGAQGRCPASYRDVIAEITARGALIVAAPGNEGGPVGAPANCAGVAAVAGLRHAGTKVGFSNLGPEIAVGAPAGNCVNLGGGCLFSLDTTFNLGRTTPATHGYTDQFTFNVGTSFSAPIVSGIAALMLSVNGNLHAAELIGRLREGAMPFPGASDPTVPQCRVPAGPRDVQGFECVCTTEACGAGMANAVGAVNAALRPIAAVSVSAPVAAGQNVELSAAGSAAACGHAISDYAWTIMDDETGGGGIAQTDPATAVVVAPAAGTYTVRLTVTDDAGRQDTADVLLGADSATTTARENAGTDACLPDIDTPAFPASVSVVPATATVQAGGGTQTFTATVSNTPNTAVIWQVNGIEGGDATVGTVSSAGTYAAPATVPSPATVTVTAVWSGDPDRFGSADVAITPPPDPATDDSSGGGGGALDPFTLMLVALGGLLRAAVPRAGSALPQIGIKGQRTTLGRPQQTEAEGRRDTAGDPARPAPWELR